MQGRRHLKIIKHTCNHRFYLLVSGSSRGAKSVFAHLLISRAQHLGRRPCSATCRRKRVKTQGDRSESQVLSGLMIMFGFCFRCFFVLSIWTGWSLNPTRTQGILVAMTVTSFHSPLWTNLKNAHGCYSGPGYSGWPTETLTGTGESGEVNKWAQILHCQKPSQLNRSFMPLLIHGSLIPSVLLWPPRPNFKLFRKPQLPRLPEHDDFSRSQAYYTRKRLLDSSHLGLSQFTKKCSVHTPSTEEGTSIY